MYETSHQNQLFDCKQAASYLNFSPRTLDNSRYTGFLGGVPAPKYKKLGKAIRYSKQSLDQWLEQFHDQANTGENTINHA